MTQDPSTLQNLLTRVEAATGADREIDRALWSLATGNPVVWSNPEVFDPETVVTEERWGPGAAGNPVYTLDPFTASIDAALALVDRMLPGSIWQIHHHSMSGEKGSPYCSINPNRIDDHAHEIFGSDGVTAPLAILAALLKALIAQAGVSP